MNVDSALKTVTRCHQYSNKNESGDSQCILYLRSPERFTLCNYFVTKGTFRKDELRIAIFI